MNPMIWSRLMDPLGIRYLDSHTWRCIDKGMSEKAQHMLAYNVQNAIVSVAGV